MKTDVSGNSRLKVSCKCHQMNRFNVLFHKMDKPIVSVVAPPRNNGQSSLI